MLKVVVVLTMAAMAMAEQYYLFEQFSDTLCNAPIGMSLILLNKCYSKDDGTSTSPKYAKATFTAGTAGSTGGSTGTLTILEYKDSACTSASSVLTSPSLLFNQSLPAGNFGPFGTFSPCQNSFKTKTSSVALPINNYGGLYSFSDPIQLQQLLTTFAKAGPVYTTYADSWCTKQNSATDFTFSNLPIYATWYATNLSLLSLISSLATTFNVTFVDQLSFDSI